MRFPSLLTRVHVLQMFKNRYFNPYVHTNLFYLFNYFHFMYINLKFFFMHKYYFFFGYSQFKFFEKSIVTVWFNLLSITVSIVITRSPTVCRFDKRIVWDNRLEFMKIKIETEQIVIKAFFERLYLNYIKLYRIICNVNVLIIFIIFEITF